MAWVLLWALPVLALGEGTCMQNASDDGVGLLQASIKSHAPGCPDCAGQPGCDCGGNCNRCVASEAGCAQGGCAAITTVCQANCNQGGGFCGDGLGNLHVSRSSIASDDSGSIAFPSFPRRLDPRQPSE
ncbi:unnamed protein product [Polarella glacialis]|uniref:Uncharacterized protein n=1 Tax=Polarella glacialis TaxID=89957 RepID=A0A813D5M5_POLGL|nr:unnamed protein product [Polarella glacialis]